MNEIEINKTLHSYMVGGFVDCEEYRNVTNVLQVCDNCGSHYERHNFKDPDIPLYASEYSRRMLLAEVEAKFIAEFGTEKYGVLLGKEIGGQLYHIGLGMDKFYEEFVSQAATATALQRATAMANHIKQGDAGRP